MKKLRDSIQKGEFIITCEFVPGRGKEGAAIEAAVEFAAAAAQTGFDIHAVSLTDNPGGNPAIMPDALAPEIRKHGIDTLVHVSCRDLNRNALESRLTALARTGTENILIITGDYPASGFEGNAAAVFDLDAVQAIKYVKAMNAGLQVPGAKKGTTSALPQTQFLVAAAVSPFKRYERELLPQFFKLERKIAAGADIVIPQLGYDMRKFLEIKRYLAARNLNVPIFGNVYVLSYGAAKAMHSGAVPGCVVTDELLRVLEEESKEADKGKAKRLERAAKMVAVFKGMGFAGVHIGGFGLKIQDFKQIVSRAAELQPQWQDHVKDLCFGRKDEFYAFPPPTSYAPGAPDPDPLPRLGCEPRTFSYAIAQLMHSAAFERDAIGCKLLTSYYKAIGEKSLLAKASHLGEHIIKLCTFGCQDCGDCALPDMAYCCPQGKCAKQQRNGPCGGSVNGMCEVYPEDRACVWTIVYSRLKSAGHLEDMRSRYMPPRKCELDQTSGWSNFFLNKDHSAVPTPAPAAQP